MHFNLKCNLFNLSFFRALTIGWAEGPAEPIELETIWGSLQEELSQCDRECYL